MTDSSVTARAYSLIRAKIISCELQPGSRLNISSLQAVLGLSQASVREALSRLTAEGLVYVERNRGFWVTPVSTSGFRELMEACLTLELPCIRSALKHGDPEWERSLTAAFHRSAQTLQQVASGAAGLDAYSNERQAFYEVLLSACDNEWLIWSWRLLYAQHMRYRHLTTSMVHYDHQHLGMHEEIIDAILKRDFATVEKMVVASYEEVMTMMEAALSEGAGTQPPRARRERRSAA